MAGPELATQPSPEAQAKPPGEIAPLRVFPLPVPDVGFNEAEIPASPKERARLRKQIQRELLSATQEREILITQPKDPCEVDTEVTKVTEFIKGRARAMNPIRDFDKVGYAAFNKGVSPWKDPNLATVDGPPAPVFWGIFAPLFTGMIVGAATSSAPIALAAAAFAIAPLLIPMWTGRTLFNLCAGVATAIAAPFAYAAAHIRDLGKLPGHLSAKAFLADLKGSLLGDEEKKELISQRITTLDEAVKAQEQSLLAIESSETHPYKVIEGDAERIKARYTSLKWFTTARKGNRPLL